MAPRKILARGYTFEINTGTTGSPTWVLVKGISSFTPSPSKNDADTTTFDEDGIMTHLPASRDLTISFEGKRIEDPDDGSRDPGQEAVEAWAEEIGTLRQFRYTSPGGTTRTFEASANMTNDGGGGNDDASTFSFEAHRSGPTTVS